MPSELVRRARYRVGNSLRWVSRPWRQWEISPDQATTLFGCSFGAAGWQHLRRTFQQYDTDPHIDPRRTVLWRFLKDFCPRNVFELADAGAVEGAGPFDFPWGGFRLGAAAAKDPWQSRFCGPSTDEFIGAELARSLRLLRQLQSDGYRPTVFPNSHIGGVWLISEQEERRFVVLQGNHRMAALAHLGLAKIAVRTLRGHHVYIRASDAASWPMVQSGRCSVTQAHKVLAMYFRESGFHVARRIGLERQTDAAPNRDDRDGRLDEPA